MYTVQNIQTFTTVQFELITYPYVSIPSLLKREQMQLKMQLKFDKTRADRRKIRSVLWQEYQAGTKGLGEPDVPNIFLIPL